MSPDAPTCLAARCSGVSADGSRFLLIDRPPAKRESVTRMDLMLNCTATLPKGR